MYDLKRDKSHLLSGTLFLCLHHEGFFTSLCARARLDFLEPLELELLTDLGLSDLASNCIVRMDLSIGGTYGYKAAFLLFLLVVGDSETPLQVLLGLVPKLIRDDVVDRGLGSERPTKSMLLCGGYGCRSITFLDVVLDSYINGMLVSLRSICLINYETHRIKIRASLV